MTIRQRAEWFIMRFASYNRRVDGLWVGTLGDKKDEHLLKRVEDALELIKYYDPPRYRKLLRDVKRIWIVPLIGARGQFRFETNRCSLDRKYVETSSPAEIASTIVHEATHAHPCLRKLKYPEALRYRIEQICLRQELAFLSKIPVEPEIKEQVEFMLALAPSFWSNKAYIDRYPDIVLNAARDAGFPDLATKAILKINKVLYKLRLLRR